MLTKDEAQKAIQFTKGELKKAGYKLRDFKINIKNYRNGLRVKDYNFGYRHYRTIEITIKSPKINIKEVKQLLNNIKVDTDLKSDFDVNYAYGIFNEVAKSYQEVAKNIIDSGNKIIDGLNGLWFSYNGNFSELRQQKDVIQEEGHNIHRYVICKYSNSLGLAILLYKFMTFGDIAV